MWLLRIGAIHDKLRRRVPVNCPVEFVLHFGEKFFRGFGRGVVVQRRGIDVLNSMIILLTGRIIVTANIGVSMILRKMGIQDLLLDNRLSKNI